MWAIYVDPHGRILSDALFACNGLVDKPHPRFWATNFGKKVRLIHEFLRYVLELNSCTADIFDEIGENDECDEISSNSSSQQSYVLELNSCTADIFDEIGENDECDEISLNSSSQ